MKKRSRTITVKKRNPVKRNMDKFHKPQTHRDKTKYRRKGKHREALVNLTQGQAAEDAKNTT